MPITPYLRNQAFDPKLIKEMSSAFTDACAAIGLADQADPITELVALQIIEFARAACRLGRRSQITDLAWLPCSVQFD